MEKLLTLTELATLLGVSKQTIYNRHCQRLQLPPCIKLGNLLRFKRTDVESWLNSQIETDSAPIIANAIIQPARRLERLKKAAQIVSRADKRGAL